jgi:HK97 family phage portal protein
VAVLEEGVEWQAVGVPPEEAQFLQTRQYQDTQICSIFGVPPHLVGITDRSTSWGTGIEEQTKGFVTFTLQPYLTRIEQSIGRDLLSGPERQEYFAEFLRDALVQADLSARYQAYAIGLGNGFLCPDDVREKENMNPLPDGIGQVFRGPLNMAPLGSEPEEPDSGNDAGGSSQNGNGGEDDDEATD